LSQGHTKEQIQGKAGKIQRGISIMERKASKSKKEQSGVDLLRKRYVKGDAQLEQYIADERDRLNIAELIYSARSEAGLTQTELAKLVGTTTSVISRLEDSDYEGHSMNMLKRIASALGKNIRVEFTARSA
jgi:ribosome-binding protein aMBF1 (putative translation factor)